MKRIIVLAAAACLGFGAAAHAQTSQPSPGAEPRVDRSERMERRAARMEARMNERFRKLKADLKLTSQQEPLWAPIETQVRNTQASRRAARQANLAAFQNAELPQRMEMIAERQARAAQNMRDLSAAVRPLWATLDDTQKETVRKALPGRGRWGAEHSERRG